MSLQKKLKNVYTLGYLMSLDKKIRTIRRSSRKSKTRNS